MAQAGSHDLTLRLASAVVGIPLVLLAMWAGGNWLAGVASAAALVGLYELLALLRRAGWDPLRPEGAVWGAMLVGSAALGGTAVLVALVVGAAAVMVVSVLTRRSALFVGDWSFTTASVAYVGLPLASAVFLRAGDSGFEWLLVALLGTFATDTGAYLVGRVAGRHKMAPAISPGKTWEGAIGGLVVGIGATIGLVLLLEPGASVLWAVALLGAGVGSVSQAGDLLESKLKRLAGAKDSGWLIPGHGGLLDRLDSLVLVFPLVYYASVVWPAS